MNSSLDGFGVRADSRTRRVLNARPSVRDCADALDDSDALAELLDEGSEHAGRLLTRRAVENRDLRELQRLADAGSTDAETELERFLREGRQPNS